MAVGDRTIGLFSQEIETSALRAVEAAQLVVEIDVQVQPAGKSMMLLAR